MGCTICDDKVTIKAASGFVDAKIINTLLRKSTTKSNDISKKTVSSAYMIYTKNDHIYNRPGDKIVCYTSVSKHDHTPTPHEHFMKSL